ncbi:MAG: hypothetical protein NVSMB32_09510 [Actinomycetota bacterium]
MGLFRPIVGTYRRLSPGARRLTAIVIALFGLDAFFFIITAYVLRDGGVPLDVALGSRSPFVESASWSSVPLAVISWLLLPAIVGAVIAFLLDDPMQRYLSQKEVEARAGKLMEGFIEDLKKGK